MGRRIGIGIAALIVVIVVAAAVAPYFVGRSAEAHFKARVAYVNTRYPGIHLKVDSYRRGFYCSEATLSVSGNPALSEDMKRFWAVLLGSTGTAGEFRMRINHGPIPFAAFGDGHWNFMPVLYTAGFRGNHLPAMSIVGAFKPTLYVVQYFTGATNSTLTVPPGRFSLGVAGATWQGGRLTARLNAARDRAQVNVTMKPLNYQFQNPETGKNYSGTFQGFTFSADKSRAAQGFWTGKSRWTLAGAEFKTDGKRIAKIAPADEQGETGESPDGRWLSGSAHLKQTGGSVLGWEWSNLAMDVSIGKVDAQGLHQAITALRAANGQETSLDASSAMLLYSTLPKAITPETQGAFKLALTAPDGRANVNATIKFNTPVPAAATANAAAQLDKRTNFRASVDFDRKLVDGFSTQVLGAPAAQSADQALQTLVAEDYLQATGESYHTVITYRGGVLTVNGQVVKDDDEAQPAPAPASAN